VEFSEETSVKGEAANRPENQFVEAVERFGNEVIASGRRRAVR
jgi:hypothetical protein